MNRRMLVIGISAVVIPLLIVVVLLAQNDDLMSYPVEDFTEDTAYRVLNITSSTKIEIEYKGHPATVNLLGIQTPTGRDGTKNLLRNILVGEWVYLREVKERKLIVGVSLDAYVYRAPDGLFVNLELVRLGYAQVRGHRASHIQLLKYYGDRARESGKGVWYKPKKREVETLWD